MAQETGSIRHLNDLLRRNPQTGVAVITPGVAALGQEAVRRIFQTISTYDEFCEANDPYGEHDFGSFDANGETIFFKIDYYSVDLNAASPDPADPDMTKRVIMIMTSAEY